MRDRIAILLCFHAASVGEAATASHRFSPLEAEVFWAPWDAHHIQSHSSLLDRFSVSEEPPVRILHVTDNHISIDDADPPRTSRMYSAFVETKDFATNASTSPKAEFTALLQKAREERVDLIALGGDLVNDPSPKTVSWVLQQLQHEAKDIPFIYTSGNHDWHEEGIPSEKRYDSARVPQLNDALRPLFAQSAASANAAAGPGAGRLYGKASIRGVDVFFIDNSNYQVNEEQHRFLEEELQHNKSTPAVLLMHMPLKLKGTPPLEPKQVCGHPAWGADTDDLYDVENRPKWPTEGNSPSTMSFIELVQQNSAPTGRLTALLTGHVHKDFSAALQNKEAKNFPNAASLTALACGDHRPGCQLRKSSLLDKKEAIGALQYTTLDAAEGGYRLLSIHRGKARLAVKSKSSHLHLHP